MALYSIEEADVIEVVQSAILASPDLEGKCEVVEERFRSEYRYPLKVVFVIEGEHVEIVTTYPLKGKSSK
jgi:hypothetical protein